MASGRFGLHLGHDARLMWPVAGSRPITRGHRSESRNWRRREGDRTADRGCLSAEPLGRAGRASKSGTNSLDHGAGTGPNSRRRTRDADIRVDAGQDQRVGGWGSDRLRARRMPMAAMRMGAGGHQRRGDRDDHRCQPERNGMGGLHGCRPVAWTGGRRQGQGMLRWASRSCRAVNVGVSAIRDSELQFAIKSFGAIELKSDDLSTGP